MTQRIEHLPLKKKLIYSLGQFGWSLGSYSVINLLIYFYMPLETGVAGAISPRVYQGSIILGITIIGIIFTAARLFDGIIDPIIANWSDWSASKFGKRRTFMAIGVFPFAAFSILVFFPLTNSVSVINALWLIVTLFFFFFFMTLYVTPYYAWISDLGHNSKDRLLLSTFIGITFALGLALASQAIPISKFFEKTHSPMQAFQMVMIIFACIAAFFMFLPVIMINENQYCKQNMLKQYTAKKSTLKSFIDVFKNKNFFAVIIANFAYLTSIVFIGTGMFYYVTVLPGLGQDVHSKFMLIIFALSIAFYIPINLIARKFGKKKLLVFAFILLGVTFLIFAIIGLLPVNAYALLFPAITFTSISFSIFGILPNAVIADIAKADGISTGNYRTGLFFGTKSFIAKMGGMLGILIFTLLLLLGKTIDNSLGIRLAAATGFILSITGLIFILKYDEKKIKYILKQYEKE